MNRARHSMCKAPAVHIWIAPFAICHPAHSSFPLLFLFAFISLSAPLTPSPPAPPTPRTSPLRYKKMGKKKLEIYDIGCNKGYTSANFLASFAPDYGVNPMNTFQKIEEFAR